MPFIPAPIRRVVTGHGPDGAVRVISDAQLPMLRRIDEKFVSTHLWLTEGSPADLNQAEDRGERLAGSAPPPGGSRFGVLDIAPGNQRYPQHRTDTVDYVICAMGEVDVEMGDTSVTLRAGDCLVQCGGDHAWVNRGSEPARIIFVMLDAAPKRDGSLAGTALAR